MKIYNTNEIVFDQLEFSKPKQNSMGGQHIFMNIPNKSQDESKIRIQTPICNLPFGVNEYNGKYNLDLQLNGESCNEMKDFFNEFDQQIMKTASANSFSWFKKSMHETVIQELYKRQTKQNGNYPPMFRAKMPFKQNEFDGKIFNNKQEEISLKDITKGCKVQAIIENTGIYFVSKDFGVSWKIIQLKVFPSEKLSGYSFIDE